MTNSLMLFKSYLIEGVASSSIAQLMHQGGPILWWLALVLVLFWVLVLDKLIYLYWSFPKQQKQWVQRWQKREDRHSWYALAQRDAWLSEAESALVRSLSFMRVLVSLFPMLGLLGTVTGMISVFDVMAAQGNSDPKLMASGISMATLPTMAGMVAALVGMFIYARLRSLTEERQLHLERLLRTHVNEMGKELK